MKKLLLGFILIGLFVSCHNQNNSIDKAAFGIDGEKLDSIPLERSKYSQRSFRHFNIKKDELQTVLPNIILSQVEVYKNLLKEWEKKKIYSSSMEEYARYMQEENNKALDSLISKDVEVNLTYFDLIGKLEQENINYADKYNFPIDSLKSFYELDKIILSDEVNLKIQELIKDDKKRSELVEKEKREEMIMDGPIVIASFIPTAGAVAKLSISTLNPIAKGLKYAKHGWELNNNVSPLAQKVYNLSKNINDTKLGQNILNLAIKSLSNDNKRLINANKIVENGKKLIPKTVIGTKVTYDNMTSKEVNLEKNRNYFKTIENRIEGRIGDFSDGILAVHLQNIRETIKYNQAYITNYNK